MKELIFIHHRGSAYDISSLLISSYSGQPQVIDILIQKLLDTAKPQLTSRKRPRIQTHGYQQQWGSGHGEKPRATYLYVFKLSRVAAEL